MKPLRILVWVAFLGCFLFYIWQGLAIYISTGLHLNMFDIEFATGKKGESTLQYWLHTTFDTGNVLRQAVLNTKVDCVFIICYVSVMFMLSYHQMQRKTWFPINNLLRLNLLLCFVAGLLDYVENGFLFYDFHHALTDHCFISTAYISAIKFILIGWIVLVWLAGYFVNTANKRNAIMQYSV